MPTRCFVLMMLAFVLPLPSGSMGPTLFGAESMNPSIGGTTRLLPPIDARPHGPLQIADFALG